jgi:hypothetical protein
MKSSALGKLIRLIEKHLFPKAHGTAAMNCESETVKDPAQESAAPFFTPDPYDATKCDMCGRRKESVCQRRAITVGLETGTVRTKFCDECAATVAKQAKGSTDEIAGSRTLRRKMAEPPANADFLFYHEGPNVLVSPQNSTAREFLQTTLAGNAAQWFSGALVVEAASVVPIAHKLVAAGFVGIGESAFVQAAPRLYVDNGKRCLYTGGRAIPPELARQMLTWHILIRSLEAKYMDKAPPEVWKAFMDFLAGFTAARELHARAGSAGCFVECVCLGASLVDALLRVALVLQYQLDHRTRDIPLGLVFQGPSDPAISEREIYRRARGQLVIDTPTFDDLQRLYDDRNRVIHRYIISRITTSDVLDIAMRYERMIEKLNERIYALEERQIEEQVGITVRGPSPQNDEERGFLKDWIKNMADEKHTPILGKLIRGSEPASSAPKHD